MTPLCLWALREWRVKLIALIAGVSIGEGSSAVDGVLAYRTIPIVPAPHASLPPNPSGLESFPPWPSEYDWGTALRARFIGPNIIVATILKEETDPWSIRRAAIVVRRATAGSQWTITTLAPIAGCQEAVVGDANSAGTIVGASIVTGPPAFSVATIWQLEAGATGSVGGVPVFMGGVLGACLGTSGGSMVASAITAIGARQPNGTALLGGTVSTIPNVVAGDVFSVEFGPAGLGIPQRLGGGPICPPPPSHLPTDAWRVGRVGAVGQGAGHGPTLFGSSSYRSSAVQMSVGCRMLPAWAATRWQVDSESIVREPFVCPDPGGGPISPITLPDGDLGLDRTHHISTVCDAAPSAGSIAIAAGAIEYELFHGTADQYASAWCDSYAACIQSHAAAYGNPYGSEVDIDTIDLHYTITAEQTDKFVQSDIARLVHRAARPDQWFAVGARLSERKPWSPFVELKVDGVIWQGIARPQGLEWCGRSANDAAVTQRLCYGDVNSPRRVCTVTAVHDVFETGVALAIGDVGPAQGPTGRWLILLTDVQDINGDLQVDGIDLAALLAEFGSSDDPVADLNGDGIVDGLDLTAMLSKWGFGTAGRAATVNGICSHSMWESGTELPIHPTLTLLGLGTPDSFGQDLTAMEPETAVSLCCFVVDVARALGEP